MIRQIVRWMGGGLLIVGVVVGGILVAWYARQNASQVDPDLVADVWPAVADGNHNANTDLTFWRDQFYLVHARSPFHMGTSDSRLVVLRSPDGIAWEELAVLQTPGEDIRDPKLTVINDKLILYALKNATIEPKPFNTVAATSNDGVTWSPFVNLEPEGWLFWRPKTLDGETWYNTAYWHEHGRSALFRSTDGLAWEFVSEIHSGDRNDETALEFLADGRMLVTARLEGDDRAWHQGSHNAGTLLAVAEPPYTEWRKSISRLTRLDGPVLFSVGEAVYAAGRYDPDGHDAWYGMSSLLGRKRTALYRVTEDSLEHLTDFPSSGDTSYAGAVLHDGQLYVSYYTSDTARDYPWVIGLVLPSDIMLARVPLDRLQLAGYTSR